MHTFFINTSGKEIGSYSEILEIQHETRRLVSLDCPIDKWNDAEAGYKSCALKMGEMIDNYKDMNNSYNLLIYLDLIAYEKYTSIPMDKHRERYACLKALHSLLKHYVLATLINELDICGRTPREILLIFEENCLPKDGDETTEQSKKLIRDYTRELLGITSVQEMDKQVYPIPDGDRDSKAFCEKIEKSFVSCLGESVLSSYTNQIEIFLRESESRETTEEPLKRLLDRIIDCSDSDDKAINSVIFVTDRRAETANKQQRARRDLRLCFYVFSCADDETIFDNETKSVSGTACVKQFPDVDWETAAAELAVKGSLYQIKYKQTQQLSESFTDMKLAPALYQFDNERFALDEYGKPGKIFDIVDVDTKKDTAIHSSEDKVVAVNAARGNSWFSENEFHPFNYKGDSFEEELLGRRVLAEQYIEEACRLRKHHLDYLERLREHISDALSCYAGRSSENEPALLRKRKVSVAEDDFEEDSRDYKYTKPGKLEETKKLKNVLEASNTAYQSVLRNYLDFCAGRSVAITDIEEQCNRFVTKVHQIKKSLKRLWRIALGLLAAIIALYIPFAVVQWESITKDTSAVITAILSVAVPIAVLYLIFAVFIGIQRKKYRKAWKNFKKQSDDVLEKNAEVAEEFDRLLTVFVPSLRWAYEYKLDVDFYEECCKIARAKISHHIKKLHDRAVTVGNIIEDLETDISKSELVAGKASAESDNEVDYNVSFCSGVKNKRFYSIINSDFLKSVYR